MGQQMLKHNQGIVRGPPILLFKFSQSVFELYQFLIRHDSFINKEVIMVLNEGMRSQSRP